MKVILLQDVARIGRRHEEATVPDGYALNQLIPKNMALPATPQNRKRIAKITAGKTAQADATNSQFATAAEQLSRQPLIVTAEANEKDHLFQAVHEADVVAAATAAGVAIESSWIQFGETIKALGEHTVTLAHNGQTATFTLTVART